MNSKKNETCRYHDLDNHKITIKANKENDYKMGNTLGLLLSSKYKEGKRLLIPRTKVYNDFKLL